MRSGFVEPAARGPFGAAGRSAIRVEERLPFPTDLASLHLAVAARAHATGRVAGRGPHAAPQQSRPPERALARVWPQVASTGTHCDVDDGEGEQDSPLLGGTSPRRVALPACLLLTGVTVWLSLLTALYALFWIANASMARAADVAEPYVDEAINATMVMIENAAATTLSVRRAAAGGETVVSTSLPQMFAMLNTTQAMLTRMQGLATHPVVRVSLGED